MTASNSKEREPVRKTSEPRGKYYYTKSSFSALFQHLNLKCNKYHNRIKRTLIEYTSWIFIDFLDNKQFLLENVKKNVLPPKYIKPNEERNVNKFEMQKDLIYLLKTENK